MEPTRLTHPPPSTLIPRMPKKLPVLLLTLLAAFSPSTYAAGKAKHVVVVVMDAPRPDSVTAEDMPNLARLATAGTFFLRHHPVYVSSTEVNGTSLATGAKPSRNGVMA